MLKNNLLLVEDDYEIAKKLFSTSNNLESIGNVELSVNLKEAIKKLSEGNFNIVILDLNLPDGSGVELLKWLRNKNFNLKVFIFSLNIELKKICLKLGAHSFFDKSKDFDFLIDTLDNSHKN